MGRKVEYKGKVYNSLTSLCEQENVNYSTVKYRLKEGCTLEEALDKNRKAPAINAGRVIKARKGREVTVNGKVYRSIAAACRDIGVNVSTITQRMQYGYTLQEAFDFNNSRRSVTRKKGSGSRETHLIFNGREYKSISEFCKKNGLLKHYEQIIKRLQKEEELSDILASLRKRPEKDHSITVNGHEYANCIELCRANDCIEHYAYFIDKIRKGKDPEEAFMEIKELQKKRIENNDKEENK